MSQLRQLMSIIQTGQQSSLSLARSLVANNDRTIHYLANRFWAAPQILATCAVLLLSAACGMPIGYSAVLLPQLQENSTEISISTEIGSWIGELKKEKVRDIYFNLINTLSFCSCCAQSGHTVWLTHVWTPGRLSGTPPHAADCGYTTLPGLVHHGHVQLGVVADIRAFPLRLCNRHSRRTRAGTCRAVIPISHGRVHSTPEYCECTTDPLTRLYNNQIPELCQTIKAESVHLVLSQAVCLPVRQSDELRHLSIAHLTLLSPHVKPPPLCLW